MSEASMHAVVRDYPLALRAWALALGLVNWAACVWAMATPPSAQVGTAIAICQAVCGALITLMAFGGSRMLVDLARRRLMPDARGRHLYAALILVFILHLMPCLLRTFACFAEQDCGTPLVLCSTLAACLVGWSFADWMRQLALHPRRANVIGWSVVGLVLCLALADKDDGLAGWLRQHADARTAALATLAVALLGLSWRAILLAQGAMLDDEVSAALAEDDGAPDAAASCGRTGPGAPVRHRLVSACDWIRHCAGGWFHGTRLIRLALVQCVATCLQVWLWPTRHAHAGIDAVFGILLWVHLVSISSCFELNASLRQDALRPISRRHLIWLVYATLGYAIGIRLASQWLGALVALVALEPSWLPLAPPLLILTLACVPLMVAVLALAATLAKDSRVRDLIVTVSCVAFLLVTQAWSRDHDGMQARTLLLAVTPIVMAVATLMGAWSLLSWRRVDFR